MRLWSNGAAAERLDSQRGYQALKGPIEAEPLAATLLAAFMDARPAKGRSGGRPAAARIVRRPPESPRLASPRESDGVQEIQSFPAFAIVSPSSDSSHDPGCRIVCASLRSGVLWRHPDDLTRRGSKTAKAPGCNRGLSRNSINRVEAALMGKS